MITDTRKLSEDRTIHQFWGAVSNIYIIEDSRQKATFLVDCGMPSDAVPLAEAIQPMFPLQYIVCTHFHVDHVAGWLKLKEIFKDLSIRFHETSIPFIRGQKRVSTPSIDDYLKILRPCMKEYGYFPKLEEIFGGALYGTPFKKGFPEKNVIFFSDQQSILPGFLTILTPGHRPDSVSFFDPDSGVFISGDFLLVVNGRMKNNTFVSNAKDQEKSIAKIKGIENIRTISPGHGVCLSVTPDVLNNL